MAKRITRLRLKNFKSIEDEEYRFTDFNLIVGRNNDGKSTILQGIAIWQFCVDYFISKKRKGTAGVRIILPDFTPIPLVEANHLWREQIDRRKVDSRFETIKIDIILSWAEGNEPEETLGIQLRYSSPQVLSAVPIGGWPRFKTMQAAKALPQIVYVPPFSGLEPTEIRMDDTVIRRYMGKAQPGSVLRNLLLQVKYAGKSNWQSLTAKVAELFEVTLAEPNYTQGISTEIDVRYKKHGGKSFDILSAGSGFIQTLLLLAVLHGKSSPDAILYDEPDAHLHPSLQIWLLKYFQSFKHIQFILTSHSQDLINGVSNAALISVLSGEPRYGAKVAHVIEALSSVENSTAEYVRRTNLILYIEGVDDRRILESWAQVMAKHNLLSEFYIYPLAGTSKKAMVDGANNHFNALRQIVPDAQRLQLLDKDIKIDYASNPVITEWSRRHIDTYLMVPQAWKSAVADALNVPLEQMSSVYSEIIDTKFSNLGLAMPLNLNSVVFDDFNAKDFLFESDDSLFNLLKAEKSDIVISRERVALNMKVDDMHPDIHAFFERLQALSDTVKNPPLTASPSISDSAASAHGR